MIKASLSSGDSFERSPTTSSFLPSSRRTRSDRSESCRSRSSGFMVRGSSKKASLRRCLRLSVFVLGCPIQGIRGSFFFSCDPLDPLDPLSPRRRRSRSSWDRLKGCPRDRLKGCPIRSPRSRPSRGTRPEDSTTKPARIASRRPEASSWPV